VLVGGTDVLEGELIDAAPEWLLLALSPVRRALVPMAATVAVDGLAPRGGGAHARTEWVSAAGIAERTALLTALLSGLREPPQPAADRG
jgi:hypothetical protein